MHGGEAVIAGYPYFVRLNYEVSPQSVNKPIIFGFYDDFITYLKLFYV